MSTITVSFPAGDQRAAACFAQALWDYSGENTGQQPDTPVDNDTDERDLSSPAPGTPPQTDASMYSDIASEVSRETAGGKVDTKGVPFNEEYCSTATEPFQKTGAQAGQWKKRRGVDQAAYDSWYAKALLAVSDGMPTIEPATPNTAAAFGGAPPPPDMADAPRFSEFGPFIAWVAEQQGADRLTQADVDEAYKVVGVTMADLFPPNTPEQIADRFDKLAVFLEAKASK